MDEGQLGQLKFFLGKDNFGFGDRSQGSSHPPPVCERSSGLTLNFKKGVIE